MTQMSGAGTLTPQMQQCIDQCNTTHGACEQAMDQALRMSGAIQRELIIMLMDCADSCRLSADMMMRQSSMSPQMCRLCADICTACAQACDRIDDPAMRACAQACRTCAELCMQMASARM